MDELIKMGILVQLLLCGNHRNNLTEVSLHGTLGVISGLYRWANLIRTDGRFARLMHSVEAVPLPSLLMLRAFDRGSSLCFISVYIL